MIDFSDQTFVVASMHNKAEAIAPILVSELGMHFKEEVRIDTDALGTFSGEVERTLEPLQAAREKCKLALKWSDSSVAVATEGSFFPHPQIPFAYLHAELVLLYFPKHQYEMHYMHYTTETNFGGKLFTQLQDALVFAMERQFPSHGMIVKRGANDLSFLAKNSNTWTTLKDTALQCIEQHSQVYLETDMRAMRNPTRMNEIGAATKRLVSLLKNRCPQCAKPGFGLLKSLPGLECELCEAPTRLEKRRIRVCSSCDYAEQEFHTGQEEKASAMHCDYCNP